MVQESLKKIVIICGPTAVGKTSVSTTLSEVFDGEIINADSQQVWRGLDIGTAKPLDFIERIPHHIIDVVDPDEGFDASRFVELADKAISDIVGRGKNAFVVGGTGLYLKMLVKGICDAPPKIYEFRLQLEEEIKSKGIYSLYERLKRTDPVTAKFISENDKTRIIRALEIFEYTGIPASEVYKMHCFSARRYNALKIGLNIAREILYNRINERVDHMIKSGFVEEVQVLLKKHSPSCQAFSAIGYRELAQYLSGNISLDEATYLIQRNSRRYAKRQLTWFRADDEIKWYDPEQMEAIKGEVERFMSSN